MKTTKQISKLILLAILSFSCGEDEATKTDVDDSKIDIPEAIEYLYQENAIYSYFIEQGDKEFVFEMEREIETFEYYEIGNLKYIEFTPIFSNQDDKNNIQCADNERLYSVYRIEIDSISESQYEKLNLNQDSWLLYDIDEIEDNYKYENNEIATRQFPNVNFQLGDTIVNCIRVKYNAYSLLEYKNNPSESKSDSNTYHDSFEEIKTVWYAKNIGIVKEYFEKIRVRGNLSNLDTMYSIVRKSLTKIEKKVSP